MSGDNSALAAAAAQIADLQSRLAATQQAMAAVQAAAMSAQQAQAAAQAQVRALEQKLSEGDWVDQQQIASLQQQLVQACADRDRALANFTAVNAKFEALYGVVETGITQGPALYVTSDGQQFPTLAQARAHRLALAANVTDAQATAILANVADIMPLLR